MMEKKIGKKIEVHLVQHNFPINLKSRMATSLYPTEREQLVQNWTAEGKYGDSIITRHQIQNLPDPALPSWQIGFKHAINSDADFFLWLEDDAFVYDESCDLWPTLLQDVLVGSYRSEPHGYIRNAHYVCARQFVEKFIPVLENTSSWNIHKSIFSDEKNKILNKDAPRMESALTKHAGSEWVKLNSSYAGRYSSKTEGRKYLFNLLKKVCPDELDLIFLDFPDTSKAELQ